MGGSSGGRADKLGNRYEGLWVARQLLHLLAEEVVAVQLEAVGDEEEGVDVWVTQKDGTRDAQQCKRKNRTVGRWGVGELRRQGVLAGLTAQLGRDPQARFTFVSANAAPELRELCELARASGGDADLFVTTTLDVQAHAEPLRKFCRGVGADPGDPAGRAEAHDLLRRTHTHLFEDSHEGRNGVAVLARCLINGDPHAAVAALADYAQSRLGESIGVDELRRHLRERALPPVHIAGCPQVAERVEQLRKEFEESLRPSLLQDALVPRPEADAVFERIVSGTDRLVVLHGRSGSGKSCVLLRLVQRLGREGVPFLPLRLDRRPPRTGALDYGQRVCGLPESPAVVMRSLFPGRRSVLVLDQLDAVRWTASHASAPWEACRELIDEALSLPDVAVVVCCRTFDLRDDQQIRAWHSDHKGAEVEVGDLPDEIVSAIVAATGATFSLLSARQRRLLRTPLHLALWVRLAAAGGPATAWGTQADLLRDFWRTRFEEAARLGVPAAETREAVAALVGDMDRRGELSAPSSALDAYPNAGKALKTLQVVAEAGRRLAFAHQSFFEYLSAVRLLDEAGRGGATLAGWVAAGDQSLLRREQLRLALVLLRDEDPDAYLHATREIVHAPAGPIRFHMRQLALRLLGEAATPTAPEAVFACELLEDPRWRGHALDQLFTRQPAWLEAADDRGQMAKWLSSPDRDLAEAALTACRWWPERCGDRVARLLRPYMDRPDPWPLAVATCLPRDPADDCPELFAMRLTLVRRGIIRSRHLSAQTLADRHPGRLIDLLDAYLERWRGHPDEFAGLPHHEAGFPNWLQSYETEHLERVATSTPGPLFDRLMSHVVRTSESARDPETRGFGLPTPFERDLVWTPAHEFPPHGHVPLVNVVARAAAALASADPDGFRSRYADRLGGLALAVQWAFGLAMAQADERAADLAVGWLRDDPRRVTVADKRGRRWGIATRIIGRHAAACSDENYGRLEAMILGYVEPDEAASVDYRRLCEEQGWEAKPDRVGLAGFAMLACLPPDRKSPAARLRADALERKYGRPAGKWDRGDRNRIRSVVAPISAEEAAPIGDEEWLRVIREEARPGLHPTREIDEYSAADVSAEGFARVMGREAARHPSRFADLAMRIPEDADPAYLEAVISSISRPAPPDPEPADWCPGTDGQIAALVEHVGFQTDEGVGLAVCRLMRDRPSAIKPACLAILIRYAVEHPCPAPDWVLVLNREPDRDMEAMNCPRGVAVEVITRMLFDDSGRLAELLPTLRSAAVDRHPAIRAASVEGCLAAWNADRNLAVELFLKACGDDTAVLASRHVARFVRYTQRWYHDRLEPLLRRMADSPDAAISTAGSGWLTLAAFYGCLPPGSVTRCATGTAAQRRGVASAATHNCEDAESRSRCVELLEPLVDDPEKEVRDEAADFLRRPGVLASGVGRRLATRFAEGRGFVEHSSEFVETLREYSGPLAPLAGVFAAACDRLAAGLADPAARSSHRHGFALDRFVPLILRFYEQAEQGRARSTRDLCLDWWDRLLQARVGGPLQLLGELESDRSDGGGGSA